MSSKRGRVTLSLALSVQIYRGLHALFISVYVSLISVYVKGHAKKSTSQ
jgi:hypothetical protein